LARDFEQVLLLQNGPRRGQFKGNSLPEGSALDFNRNIPAIKAEGRRARCAESAGKNSGLTPATRTAPRSRAAADSAFPRYGAPEGQHP